MELAQHDALDHAEEIAALRQKYAEIIERKDGIA